MVFPLAKRCGRLLTAVLWMAVLWVGVFLVGGLTVGTGVGFAEESYYTAKVLPLLKERCFACHSHAAKKTRGGLALDSIGAMRTGGDSGAAVEAGKPEESLLLSAVRREGLEMPPAGKGAPLTGAEIAILERWIKEGALGPAEREEGAPEKLPRRRPGGFTEQDRSWWAIQPLRSVTPPHTGDLKKLRNEIDPFVEARLAEAGLTSAGEASAAVLIRRVTLDLTGLPPTPEEIDEFVAASARGEQAYEQLVDRLLASPAYGERMARQWLDLVRYADGDGYRADDYRPHAWRYRDYVIRSLNDDKPYDRFVQEQLAGDELFPQDPEAIVATGYLRHGIYEWNARDVRGQWDNMLNDITDTTGDVFFGLGLQCARCHDHKFDPILQRDYFRLRAVFAAIQPGDVAIASEEEKGAHDQQLGAWNLKTVELQAQLAALEKPYLDKAEREAVGRFPDDIQAMIRKPAGERAPLEAQLAALAWRQVIYDWERVDRTYKPEDKERILALRRELAALEKEKPPALAVAFAAADVGPQAPIVAIPQKSDAGDIEPGVPSLLDAQPLAATPTATSTGRRSALAKWLTTPENPLTSRVIVNRVWQQHFGKGLAANASDFGILGEAPSHPELLAWLANWFVEEGWSLKKLHRLIVLSAAYRRGGEQAAPEAGLLADPENRLLWRRTPQRLDAEQIRDAMLHLTGELRSSAGGPGKTPDAPVRTIYTRFMRNTRDAIADHFDAPLWFTSAASRDTTTTPVQSLLLLNGAAIRARGRALATRVSREGSRSLPQQIEAGYRLVFGRAPDAEELAEAMAFLSRQQLLADAAKLDSDQAGFAPGKIPYRDGQAADLSLSGKQTHFRVETSQELPPVEAFTVEAFIMPRSISESGELRTIVAKWNGDLATPGWSLGITGQKSRRKPLTLVLQTVGRQRDGKLAEVPIFSDLTLQLHKPYFVAASVTPAMSMSTTGREGPGEVFFALKDLSNEDEPLLTASVKHDVLGGWDQQQPLTLGGRSGKQPQSFDGLLDDVRVSRGALPATKLLLMGEQLDEATIGYWKFEAKPDVFADAGPGRRELSAPKAGAKEEASSLTPQQAALADFCHALLNASEFFYVE